MRTNGINKKNNNSVYDNQYIYMLGTGGRDKDEEYSCDETLSTILVWHLAIKVRVLVERKSRLTQGHSQEFLKGSSTIELPEVGV